MTDHVEDDALANARLAAIVDSSFDAIIAKDMASVITNWNAAAVRLFGYTPEEAIGRSIRMLIPDRLQAEEEDIIGRIRRGERVPTFETMRIRRDGTEISVSITVSPIKDRNGRIVGASKIARDITAVKENERRIATLLREVNHRVKNQFAVILSMVRETVNRTSEPREVQARIRDRVMALSRTHDLLVNSLWAGADMATLAKEHLAYFGNDKRVTLTGPDIMLRPNAVQNVGMAIHELGSNSARYGALSVRGGHVAVSWRQAGDTFELDWAETMEGHVAEREERAQAPGFGSVVLTRVTPQSLGGTAAYTRSENRLDWSLRAPMSAVGDGKPDGG